MPFDAEYNQGKSYWTVFGIRFSEERLAGAYALHKAEQFNNPVKIIQYDRDNPNGFGLYTAHPTTDNAHEHR